MKLKKLLQEVPLNLYRGNKEIEITGISENSKKVVPGNLFIARKGHLKDGADYIEEAISSGAVAILSESENPLLKDVVQLTHPDIRSIQGKIASSFYGHPSKELFLVAVVGTNGKTTITYILRHLLGEVNTPTGLIGTIECHTGEKSYSSSENTTPDVLTNHKMLCEMRKNGCLAAVMEVTSHALVQKRVDEIDFDIAIFTNLTQDHLDYHGTMENYALAKKQIFQNLTAAKWGVFNLDSSYCAMMMDGCLANHFTYSISNNKVDIYAYDIALTAEGSTFLATYKGKTARFSTRLIGRHNVSNLLASMGVLLIKGIPFEALPDLVATVVSVPGRLERVGKSAIFVDYAHTPDALEKVLAALKELHKGKIITVFGCGGDRDRGKRPQMAQVAERYSDLVIVTSDNSRNEEPKKIIDEIVKGFKKTAFVVEEDRKKAIFRAVLAKTKEDLILIAGKGHETYQIFSNLRVNFDDRKVAEEALKER